jgi:hypothetical protein
VAQPGPRPKPLALDRAPGSSEGRRGLLLGEAGEETAFDDLDQALVMGREAFEGLVESQQSLDVIVLGSVQVVDQGYRRLVATALASLATASKIDHDLAHGGRHQGKEMAAVTALDARLCHQLEVCLVDQAGGVEGRAALPAKKLRVGDSPELIVEVDDNLLEGPAITSLALGQTSGRVKGRVRSLRHQLSPSRPAVDDGA